MNVALRILLSCACVNQVQHVNTEHYDTKALFYCPHSKLSLFLGSFMTVKAAGFFSAPLMLSFIYTWRLGWILCTWAERKCSVCFSFFYLILPPFDRPIFHVTLAKTVFSIIQVCIKWCCKLYKMQTFAWERIAGFQLDSPTEMNYLKDVSIVFKQSVQTKR